MEILPWAAPALVALGVLSAFLGTFGRPKLTQAGPLLCASGMVLSAVYDAHRERWGLLTVDLALIAMNVFVFFWFRRDQRRKAAQQ